MGEITTFQSLQNENTCKIDEIRPNRPKNDPFCLTGTPHLRKRRQITQASCGSCNQYKN